MVLARIPRWLADGGRTRSRGYERTRRLQRAVGGRVPGTPETIGILRIGYGGAAVYSSSMAKLPGWVVDDVTSVREEAAFVRPLSFSDRARLTRMACRAAARQLAQRPDRERLLAYRDPLPASSVALFERLRAEYRAKHGKP